MELFEDFDPVDFREVCNNHKELPKIQDLAKILRDILENDPKQILIDYLRSIVLADGHFDPEAWDLGVATTVI